MSLQADKMCLWMPRKDFPTPGGLPVRVLGGNNILTPRPLGPFAQTWSLRSPRRTRVAKKHQRTAARLANVVASLPDTRHQTEVYHSTIAINHWGL